MTLASGQIRTVIDPVGIPGQYRMYTADQNVQITFMQFTADNIVNIDLTISIVFFTGESRIIPKDVDFSNKDMLQFEAKYDMIESEYIFITANGNNTIDFIIRGDIS